MTEEKLVRVRVTKNIIVHGAHAEGNNAVRWVRESRGITQQELEQISGVSQNSISRIESGKRRPHKSTLEKLAAAMGVKDWTALDIEVPGVIALEEITEWDPEHRRRLFELYRETGFLEQLKEEWEESYLENRGQHKDDPEKEEYIASKLEHAYMLGYAKGFNEGRKQKGEDGET